VTTPGRASPVAAALRPAGREDFDSVVELLEASGLPTAGLPPGLSDFYVAEHGRRLVGAIGLEPYGRAGLLRSAVVDPAFRGSGIGEALVRRVLDHARERGVAEIFLLTTTAERYFPRFGFAQIARDGVPRGVRDSVEFREACPASAVAMRANLSTS
jgi:amino-acid N-acetyltransferase